MDKELFINQLYEKYSDQNITKEDINKMLSRGFIVNDEDFLNTYLNNSENFFEKFNKFKETEHLLTAYEVNELLQRSSLQGTSISFTDAELGHLVEKGIIKPDTEAVRISLNSDAATEQHIQGESLRERALRAKTESSYNIYLFSSEAINQKTYEFWQNAKEELLQEKLEEDLELEAPDEDETEEKKPKKKKEEKKEEKDQEQSSGDKSKKRTPRKRTIRIPTQKGYIEISPKYTDSSFDNYSSGYSYDTETTRAQEAASTYDFEKGSFKVLSDSGLAQIVSYVSSSNGNVPLVVTQYDENNKGTVVWDAQENIGSYADFKQGYYDNIDIFETPDTSSASDRDIKYGLGAIGANDFSKDEFSVKQDDYGNSYVVWNAPTDVPSIHPAVYEAAQNYTAQNFPTEPPKGYSVSEAAEMVLNGTAPDPARYNATTDYKAYEYLTEAANENGFSRPVSYEDLQQCPNETLGHCIERAYAIQTNDSGVAETPTWESAQKAKSEGTIDEYEKQIRQSYAEKAQAFRESEEFSKLSEEEKKQAYSGSDPRSRNYNYNYNETPNGYGTPSGNEIIGAAYGPAPMYVEFASPSGSPTVVSYTDAQQNSASYLSFNSQTNSPSSPYKQVASQQFMDTFGSFINGAENKTTGQLFDSLQFRESENRGFESRDSLSYTTPRGGHTMGYADSYASPSSAAQTYQQTTTLGTAAEVKASSAPLQAENARTHFSQPVEQKSTIISFSSTGADGTVLASTFTLNSDQRINARIRDGNTVSEQSISFDSFSRDPIPSGSGFGKQLSMAENFEKNRQISTVIIDGHLAIDKEWLLNNSQELNHSLNTYNIQRSTEALNASAADIRLLLSKAKENSAIVDIRESVARATEKINSVYKNEFSERKTFDQLLSSNMQMEKAALADQRKQILDSTFANLAKTAGFAFRGAIRSNAFYVDDTLQMMHNISYAFHGYLGPITNKLNAEKAHNIDKRFMNKLLSMNDMVTEGAIEKIKLSSALDKLDKNKASLVQLREIFKTGKFNDVDLTAEDLVEIRKLIRIKEQQLEKDKIGTLRLKDGSPVQLNSGKGRRAALKDLHIQLKEADVLKHSQADKFSVSRIKSILKSGKFEGRELTAKDKEILRNILRVKAAGTGNFDPVTGINGVELLNSRFNLLKLNDTVNGKKLNFNRRGDIKLALNQLQKRASEFEELNGKALGMLKEADINKLLGSNISEELRQIILASQLLKQFDMEKALSEEHSHGIKETLRRAFFSMLGGTAAGSTLSKMYGRKKMLKMIRKTVKELRTITNVTLLAKALRRAANHGEYTSRLGKAYKKHLENLLNNNTISKRIGRKAAAFAKRSARKTKVVLKRKVRSTGVYKGAKRKIKKAGSKLKTGASKLAKTKFGKGAIKAGKGARFVGRKTKNAGSRIKGVLQKDIPIGTKLLEKVSAAKKAINELKKKILKAVLKYGIIIIAALIILLYVITFVTALAEAVTGFMYKVKNEPFFLIEQAQTVGETVEEWAFDKILNVAYNVGLFKDDAVIDYINNNGNENLPDTIKAKMEDAVMGDNNEYDSYNDIKEDETLIWDRVQYCIAMDSALRAYVESFYDNQDIINNLFKARSGKLKEEGEFWYDPVSQTTFKQDIEAALAPGTKDPNIHKKLGTTINGVRTGLHYTYFNGDGEIISMKSNAKDIVATANAWIGTDLYKKGIYKSYVEALWNYSHAVGYALRNTAGKSVGTKYIYSCDSHTEGSECHDNIVLYYCNGFDGGWSDGNDNILTKSLYAALTAGKNGTTTIHSGMDMNCYYNDSTNIVSLHKTIGTETDETNEDGSVNASIKARKDAIYAQKDDYKGYAIPISNRKFAFHKDDTGQEFISLTYTHPRTGAKTAVNLLKRYKVENVYESFGEKGSWAWIPSAGHASLEGSEAAKNGCSRVETIFHIDVPGATNVTKQIWIREDGGTPGNTYVSNTYGGQFDNRTALYPYPTEVNIQFYEGSTGQSKLQAAGCNNIKSFDFGVLVDASGNPRKPVTSVTEANKLTSANIRSDTAYYCSGDSNCSIHCKASKTITVKVKNDTLHTKDDISHSKCPDVYYHGCNYDHNSSDITQTHENKCMKDLGADYSPRKLMHDMGTGTLARDTCTNNKEQKVTHTTYDGSLSTKKFGYSFYNRTTNAWDGGTEEKTEHFISTSCSEKEEWTPELPQREDFIMAFNGSSIKQDTPVREGSHWCLNITQAETIYHTMYIQLPGSSTGTLIRWPCTNPGGSDGHRYCAGHPIAKTIKYSTGIYYCKGHRTEETHYICLGHCPGHNDEKDVNITIPYCTGYCPGHEMVEYCSGHVDLDVGIVTLYNDDTNSLHDLGVAKEVNVTTKKYKPGLENGEAPDTEWDVLTYSDSKNSGKLKNAAKLENFIFSYSRTPQIKKNYQNNLAHYMFAEYNTSLEGGGKVWYPLPKAEGVLDSKFVENIGSLTDGKEIVSGLQFLRMFVGAYSSNGIVEELYNDAAKFWTPGMISWHNNIETDNLDSDIEIVKDKITLSDIVGHYFVSFETEKYIDFNDDLSVITKGIFKSSVDISNMANVTTKLSRTHYFSGWYEYDVKKVENDDGTTTTTAKIKTDENGNYIDTGNIARVNEAMNEDWLHSYNLQFPGSYNVVPSDKEARRLFYNIAYATAITVGNDKTKVSEYLAKMKSMYTFPTSGNVLGTGFLSAYNETGQKKTANCLGMPPGANDGNKGTQDAVDFVLYWGSKFYTDIGKSSAATLYNTLYADVAGDRAYYKNAYLNEDGTLKDPNKLPKFVTDAFNNNFKKASVQFRFAMAEYIDSSGNGLQKIKNDYIRKYLKTYGGSAYIIGNRYKTAEQEQIFKARLQKLKAGDLVGIGDEVYLVAYNNSGLSKTTGYDDQGNPLYENVVYGYEKGQVFLMTISNQDAGDNENGNEDQDVIHMFSYSLELLCKKREVVWIYSA